MRPVHCIVPARMDSTRFPGKPLVSLCGREMILRTLSRARLAGCFEKIICATDSERIASVVERAGFQAILTPFADTGTDRVAFAANQLSSPLVVNLQGDEPCADPNLLRAIARVLQENPDSWVTASSPLQKEDAECSNVVKVRLKNISTLSAKNSSTQSENVFLAEDFSRRVPQRDATLWEEHRGIYAYSLKSLREFISLPRHGREVEESLEQLRVLGRVPILVIRTPFRSASVDTREDIPLVETLIRQEENFGKL